MLCYRKTRKTVCNRTNVFSDSVSYSATCYSFVNGITSFTSNTIHYVLRNTGKCFSHIKRSFRTIAEQLVINLQVLQPLRLQEKCQRQKTQVVEVLKHELNENENA